VGQHRTVEPVAHAVRLRIYREPRVHQQSPRIVGEPLAMDGGQHAQVGPASGQLDRVTCERPPRPGRTDRQHVPGAQGAAAERPHVTGEMRRAAAERGRDIEAAANRQRHARAGDPRTPAQARARGHAERFVERRRLPVDRHRDVRARGGAGEIPLGQQLRTDQRDLQRGGRRIVAEHLIGEAMRIGVHRAGHRNTQALVAAPAEVLHRRQHAGLDDRQTWRGDGAAAHASPHCDVAR
jgi:hypothetical protein